MSVESEARSGGPSTSQNEEVIEKVRQIVMEDRRLTLREIVEGVGISREAIRSNTWRFYVAFVILRKESGQTCGQGRTGSVTMTILPFIYPI